MKYEGRIFRPPSEAYSLIVQATIGCSHNNCDFCDMYKEKSFRVREFQDVLDDLSAARKHSGAARRIFIADGDALILKTQDWLLLLEHIGEIFPECERVSCYASPRSILQKSSDELKLLHKNGLNMVYMGLESGSDEVLLSVNKGACAQEIVEAGVKVKDAGIKLSVTAISGLGGKALWQEHAVKTAKALSQMKPHYIGLLSLMLERDTPLYERFAQGAFESLTPMEIAAETLLMLSNLDSEGSVFRSNHASNYLMLGGNLNRELEDMKQLLKDAIDGKVGYKDERMRRL
ncbi:MAG: B12-binding domain-containing radical SAM protein [Defluviitaleaceae bacterium]|nr:B12-binding domain-containing radical SAM protein [Defluviitaleaceae bacterium]